MFAPSLSDALPAHAPSSLPVEHGVAIRLGRPLSEAVDRFQDNPALRLLPVLDG
ncbi:hypothetical protein [Sphingobium baderi]|nr:hypothetical protein [Sphingobium baderi]